MSGGIVLQLAVDTLAAAALYSLVALAVWLAYSGSGTIHMAIGQVALTGALVAAALSGGGVPLWVAVLAGLAAGALISGVLERGLVAPSLGRPLLGAVLLVAAAVVVSEVVRGLFPHPAYAFPSPSATVILGGGVIHVADVITIAAVAAVGSVTALLLRRTLVGAALRVTAGAPRAAERIGVDTALVRTIAFAAGGALATAALLLGVNRFPLAPGAGVAGAGGVTVVLALRGIAAAVAGGMRSPLRVVAAAIVIAAAEVVGGYWLGSGGEFLSDAAAALLIAAGWRRVRPQ
jgi:branched-chain amino acid transport system permease protein